MRRKSGLGPGMAFTSSGNPQRELVARLYSTRRIAASAFMRHGLTIAVLPGYT